MIQLRGPAGWGGEREREGEFCRANDVLPYLKLKGVPAIEILSD
jgi:hypothetical protein